MTSPGPIAISIAGFDIRWYGILIASGALLALYISCKRAPIYGLASEDVLDIALGILPLGILGARIYYVIFNWTYYSDSPSEIFDIRGWRSGNTRWFNLGLLQHTLFVSIRKSAL